MTLISKKYDFEASENKWRKFWEEKKVFESQINPDKPKYSIVIPPPNVTGILHIGHILNNTIQDLYCRWKRLKGFEVCWVPGMDHAGIATQQKVVEYLVEQGKSKSDLSREEFIAEAWKWKQKYGGHILKQLRKLGASVDWSKEKFTLDDDLSEAVTNTFVDLYKKGYIYRGKRIVNWDPAVQSAISDDEIVYKEKKDKLYYIKYFLESSDEYITIATARPETMLGDTAVAVNPDDDRYKRFIDKEVILPIVNKKIKVVADKYVDVEFGTGALKVTPAHDINDFEIGQRHGLEILNVLTKDSRMNENALHYKGLGILEARKKIVEELKSNGHIEKIEDYVHNIAYGEKTGSVIEPYLSDQWFVSMKKISEPAIDVVRKGEIKFYPEKWTKTYYHWLDNLRDWCISRQLWWGHRIPIWYHNQTGEIYCESTPPVDIENWTQDPDVLDTWFSSWLWPLSVFGWKNDGNNENPVLNYYYPTDLLVTGAEIIFLWVARMIMAGMEYRKEIPFSDVYFNSIVRDGQGRKMSKSLGNSPDPLEVMDKYGTDALRFTLVYLAPLGNDILYDEEKTEIGRNFVTKLWNAGRFLNLNKKGKPIGANTNDNASKWIVSKFNSVVKESERYLNDYRLNEYTKTLYNFVWSDYCDWYIELLKVDIPGSNRIDRFSTAMQIYDKILILLHPVIPYVTEELWHILDGSRGEKSIAFEKFPGFDESLEDKRLQNDFEKLKEIIISIRNLRADNEIPFSKKCKISLRCDLNDMKLFIQNYEQYIASLCNIEELELIDLSEKEPVNSPVKILSGFEIYLSLDGAIDFAKQNEKYLKEITKLETYLSVIDKKLNNKNFLDKASPVIIEQERAKKSDTLDKLEKLRSKINHS